MKKEIKMKKLISYAIGLFAGCALCFTMVGCSSCGKKGKDNDGATNNTITIGTLPKEEATFEFRTETTEIILGNEQVIPFLTDILDVSALTFTSSNTDVVEVKNQSGHALIAAKEIGESTITATLGSESATCKVTVSLGNLSPVLQFESEEANSYGLFVNDKLVMTPYVTFNGKIYRDVVCTYSGFDTNIVTLENGELVGKTKGSTDVTATYTWRGLPLTYGTKNFALQVKDKVEFIVNDGKFGDNIALYTVASHADVAYDKEITLDVEVLVNGAAQNNIEVALTSGEDKVSYDTNTKKLSALAQGNATLHISTSDDAISKDIQVSVGKPLATYDKVIDFSTDFGAINTKVIFGDDSSIIEAYQDGKALQVVNGKVYGVKSGATDRATQTTIEVYNDLVGYSIDANVYLAKITTAEEFVEFFTMRMTDDFYVEDRGYNKDAYYITEGYVELGADIDLNGRQLKTYKVVGDKRFNNDVCAFSGTFDGKGYKVSNLVFSAGSSYGLFGNLYNGIIKNVAFTDIVFNATTSNSTLIGKGTAVQQRGVLQNMYVSVAAVGDAKNCGTLFVGNTLENLTLQNILVEYPDISERAVANNGGTLFGTATNKYPYLVENVFVISKTQRLAMEATSNVADYYVWVAQDDAAAESMATWGTSNVSTSVLVSRKVIFNGESDQFLDSAGNKFGKNGIIRRFDDYTAMAKETIDFSAFLDSGYWEVVDSVLKWKVAPDPDAYTPEGGPDSWSGNWKPDDGDTFE